MKMRVKKHTKISMKFEMLKALLSLEQTVDNLTSGLHHEVYDDPEMVATHKAIDDFFVEHQNLIKKR